MALTIRSEELKKEALLLLGGGTRASVALTPRSKAPMGLPSRIERAPNRSTAYTQWILAAWASNPEFFLQGFGTRQNHS